MTPTLIAIAATVALILLGGVTTKVGDWYRNLNKPPWNPPTWLFGPAWAVILACVGWAGLTAWTQASDPAARRVVTELFGVNLVFYLAWSPLFFWLRRPDWALIEVVFLWLSILALVVGLAPISPTASLLLAPYFLWVSFASVLNLSIVRRNAPFGARVSDLPVR